MKHIKIFEDFKSKDTNLDTNSIKQMLKKSCLSHGKLVNGSYSASIEVPEETYYSFEEEQELSRLLSDEIGVSCDFSMALGGDNESLIGIDVDSKEDLKKVLKWIEE